MAVEEKVHTEADDGALTVVISVKDLSKPLELQFHKSDTINDVLNSLEILPQVHHITSYDLYYKTQLLSTELALEEVLSNKQQKSLSIDLKNKLYDERSINDHLIKTRDIVGLNEVESFGINSGLSKVSDLNLEPIPEPKPTVAESKEEEKEDQPSPKPSDEDQTKVGEILSTFFTKVPSNFYTYNQITAPSVRALSLSSWNPVPYNFKSRGHLVYILLQTLEGETLHITGSTTGFFINKSSSAKFDPTPRDVSNASFTLYDLISKTSKNFRNQLKANKEKLSNIDALTFLKPQTTFLSNPWTTKPSNPIADYGKIQFDEQNVSKDFNDEFQSIRELPSTNIQERIIRERLLAKTSYEFTVKAVKGAVSILNGSVAPLNPLEDDKLHIFLKDNIFYSFGVDASGAFAGKGGDEAARASANQDLRAIQYFNQIDAKGIYTLLTTIVDYAGKRVVCQTPVPGLFTSTEPVDVKNEETGELEQTEGEALTKIDYGHDDSDDSIKANEDFIKGLEPIRTALHLKKQKIQGSDVELVTNPDLKGMIGTDKRKYIIDLFNSTPLDVDFIENHFDESSETSYPHKQTVVRQEAVEIWYSNKLKELIAKEAENKGIDLNATIKEGEKLPEIKVDEESLYFDLQTSSKDSNAVDLSKFISSTLIPRFIDSFDGSLNIAPIDGHSLTTSLHKHGINLRYLGTIAKILDERIAQEVTKEEEALKRNDELNEKYIAQEKARLAKRQADLKAKLEAEQKGEKYEPTADEEEEEDEDLPEEELIITKRAIYQSLKATVVQELIARASKHILRSFAVKLPVELVSVLVSHFHNVLLGSKFNPSPEVVIENEEFYANVDLSFTKLTTDSVKSLIVKEVQTRYRYDLPSSWFEEISEVKLQKEISTKFGIQWDHHDYYFTKEQEAEALKLIQQDKKSKKSKTKSLPIERKNVFESVDVTLVPIIKDSITRATTGEQFFEAGRQALFNENEEQRIEGYGLLTEAVSVYEQTYGLIHPEVQRLYQSLASIYQESGSKFEATLMARKSLAISERVHGLDSHETLVSILTLAFLEHQSGSLFNSLKLYARLSQIWTSVYSGSLSIAVVGLNIIHQLQQDGYISEALKFVPKLIEQTASVFGESSFVVGTFKFRLAYLLALNERYNESLTLLDSALEILVKKGSHYNTITKQASSLKTQLVGFINYREAAAKVAKEQEKLQLKELQSKKSSKQKASKSKGPDLSNKSVDEVLNFVLGKSNGNGKKKHKKTNKA